MSSVSIFLCHAEADRDAARTIAARLDRGAEARVILEECRPGDTVASTWEGGAYAAAILLLLSPQAVPAQATRAYWGSLLDHITSNAEPRLATVLMADCRFPRLLERAPCFRWSAQPLETLRALERWVLELHPQQQTFVPAPVVGFQGGEAELHRLWDALVDRSGVASLETTHGGVFSSSLAQQFASTAQAHFRDIVWIGCRERSRESIVGELAAVLGVGSAGDPEVGISATLRNARLLVILNELGVPLSIEYQPDARSSILITGSRGEFASSYTAHKIHVERLGTPVELQALQPGSEEAGLWDAISACRADSFPLDLPLRMTGMTDATARETVLQLTQKHYITPLNLRDARYRALMGNGSSQSQRRHAAVVCDVFSNWRIQPALCAEWLVEMETALRWSLAADWPSAVAIGGGAFRFLKEQLRWPEAGAIARLLREEARRESDSRIEQEYEWELSWIQNEDLAIRRPFLTTNQLAFDFR